MPRPFLYLALMLVVIAIGVADRPQEASVPQHEWPRLAQTPRLASCDEAILAARRSPYWRNQSLAHRIAVDCHPAPGGWRLTASMTRPEDLCELYVGRDRLIAPRLPCQGVGRLEDESSQ